MDVKTINLRLQLRHLEAIFQQVPLAYGAVCSALQQLTVLRESLVNMKLCAVLTQHVDLIIHYAFGKAFETRQRNR